MISQVMLICGVLCTQAEAQDIVGAAVVAGLAYDLPPELLLAVAEVESRFNPRARGKAGEIGVWQLHPRMPWTRRAQRHCAADPGNCIEHHAMAAAFVLAEGKHRCRRWHGALRSYNEKGGPCSGTSGYSRRVMRKFRVWELVAHEPDAR